MLCTQDIPNYLQQSYVKNESSVVRAAGCLKHMHAFIRPADAEMYGVFVCIHICM